MSQDVNDKMATKEDLRKHIDSQVEEKAIVEARLDSLSMNVENNNNMMKQIQNSIQQMSKQMNDLRLLLTEEKKSEGMDDIKKEMQIMKQNINNLMNNQSSKANGKENPVAVWLRSIVNLPEYIDLFMESGLDDMGIIEDVGANVLVEIGIDKVGHRMRILKAVRQLKQPQKPSLPQYEGSTAYI